MSIHTYLRLAERVQYTLSVVAATRCHRESALELLLPWRRPPLALRWAIFLGEQFAHIRDHKKSPHSQG